MSSRRRSTSESTTGDDLVDFIKQYRNVLDQLDEELGEDFPLWDVIERFDTSRSCRKSSRRTKQRIGEPPAVPTQPAARRRGNAAADTAEPAQPPQMLSQHRATVAVQLVANHSSSLRRRASTPIHRAASTDFRFGRAARAGRYNPKRRIVPSHSAGSCARRSGSRGSCGSRRHASDRDEMMHAADRIENRDARWFALRSDCGRLSRLRCEPRRAAI